MTRNTIYRGILKDRHKSFFHIEHHCPDKVLAYLLCKIESGEYPSAEAQVIAKSSGEVIYNCRRSAVC